MLDDLQSTLPRKNHGLNNTSSSGYREVTKSTSRTIGNGQTETNKEYEIQYLNPANKSTVLSERLPDLQSVDLLVCLPINYILSLTVIIKVSKTITFTYFFDYLILSFFSLKICHIYY